MKTWTSVIIILIVGALGYLVVTRAPKEEVTNNQETQDQNMDTQNTEEEKVSILTTKEGSGDAIKVGQTAVMNYTGRLEDGTVFDSNVDLKFNHVEPFEFTLGENRVIKGWEQGVLSMRVGEKRTLTIPASLGYGASGVPGAIPANATLVFEVELVAIK